MKRIISLLVCFMCAVTLLHAQDIIITKDARRIEAKIIEVSSESIKYHDPSNPDGPAFVMRADEISSVLFQNGHVKLYDEIPNESKIIKESVSKNYLARAGDTYYFNGKIMRGREYEQFLLQNCATAFTEYHSGKNIMIGGWVLFGCGVVGVSVCSPLVATNSREGTGEIAGLVIASASAAASIPCLCVGYFKMHYSVELFNFSCAHKQQAYWSVNASQNGVGIAYNF